jgi:hypothetical protein
MNNAYILNPDRTSSPLKKILCTNEEKELQDILERNTQLVPGDLINPEDPRRWICLRRELPIEDPNNGENRWSLDFLFLDQSGVPTFIECKRLLDTRSRREVIGQMFDYAANGTHYFSRDKFLEYLTEEATKQKKSLDELLLEIDPDSGDSIDAYLDLIENNIKEGQLRLVFFMEESPYELRSIVEFLNSQLERTEVIIVEAKQYENADVRFVIPTIWGYTEKARRVKKNTTITSSSAGGRKKWSLEKFLIDLSEKTSESTVRDIHEFYDKAKEIGGFKIRWGSGKRDGSFSIICEEASNKSFLSVYSSGLLAIPFHWMNDSDSAIKLKEIVFSHISENTSLKIDENAKDRWLSIENWTHESSSLVDLLGRIKKEFQQGGGINSESLRSSP